MEACAASGGSFSSCEHIVHISQLCLLASCIPLHSIRDGIASILNEADLRDAVLSKVIFNKYTQIDGIKLSRNALGEINMEDAAEFNQITLDGKLVNTKEAINASKAAKTFLSDVQWVYDALSYRINQYYDNVLTQSKSSFKIALIFAIIGTSVFLVTFSLFIISSFISERLVYSSIIAAIGGIGDALICLR